MRLSSLVSEPCLVDVEVAVVAFPLACCPLEEEATVVCCLLAVGLVLLQLSWVCCAESAVKCALPLRFRSRWKNTKVNKISINGGLHLGVLLVAQSGLLQSDVLSPGRLLLLVPQIGT